MSIIQAQIAPARPGQLTLFERLLGIIPLPYMVTSLLLAILLGPPGHILFHYLDTGNLSGATIGFFNGWAPEQPWQIAASLALWVALPFIAFWMIRHIRMRVLVVRAELAVLLTEGSNTYDALFSAITKAAPALVLTGLLLVIFISFIIPEITNIKGVFSLIYTAIRIPVLWLAFGTSLWVYISTLWGLHRFGQRPLKLKPFYEDGMMGAGQSGALSLSASLASMAAIPLVGPVTPAYTLTLIALTIIGTVLFFLPLNSIHQQMEKAKGKQQTALQARWAHVLRMADGTDHAQAPTDANAAEWAALREALGDLRDILALDRAEHKVQSINTWPFDTSVVRKLATIVVTILVAIITSAILKALGL